MKTLKKFIRNYKILPYQINKLVLFLCNLSYKMPCNSLNMQLFMQSFQVTLQKLARIDLNFIYISNNKRKTILNIS